MVPSSEPLPFADESFDVVISLESIEHLEHLEHLMSPCCAPMEMRRVLKTMGELVFSVPNPIGAT